MHNLFLGLVRHHIRNILQIEAAMADEVVSAATPKQMTKARKIWSNGNITLSQLNKLTCSALTTLCREEKIDLPRPEGGRKLRKKDIITALMVRLAFLLDEICF
jgi:hypothetical protein